MGFGEFVSQKMDIFDFPCSDTHSQMCPLDNKTQKAMNLQVTRSLRGGHEWQWLGNWRKL